MRWDLAATLVTGRVVHAPIRNWPGGTPVNAFAAALLVSLLPGADLPKALSGAPCAAVRLASRRTAADHAAGQPR
jgi:hypothetical protein